MITVTSKAREELERIMHNEGQGRKGVRVGVKGGGCSGFTYVMQFEDQEREFDHILNEEGVPIFVDAKSFMLLDGVEINYETSLLERGFKFNNPNASKSCGCGTSFAV